MIKIHILQSSNFSPNENAFLAPLHRHRKSLKKQGIVLGFHSSLKTALTCCDILWISSKFFSPWWGRYGFEAIKDILIKARKNSNRIFWSDISDSTGTTHFKVLPYVDKYLKNQILKDKSLYQKKYYGERIITDYYHRLFNIVDTATETPHLNVFPDDHELKKIHVGWNSGLAHYGRYRHYLEQTAWKKPQLHRALKTKLHSPIKKRQFDISGRIGCSYSRNTISLPRQKIKQQLAATIAMDKVNMGQYFHEMRSSLGCLSPFGMGEISLRDFEIVLSGASIIKQNMDHLETWPNLWRPHKTYVDFSWDLSDLDKAIDYIKSHPTEIQTRAHHAQEIYRQALKNHQNPGGFIHHFISLIT